ncbi:MAG: HNH endonuclease signature motif containing protein [Pseudomonadota bacterium]|jgi:hypothetical protein
MNLHKRYTKQEIDFIKANALKLTTEQIAQQLNRTVPGIAFKIKTLKINRRPTIKRWTADEISLLNQIHKSYTRQDLAEIFKCSYEQMVACLKNRKLSTGRDTRFKKGHIPPQKGKKIPLSKMPAAFQQKVFKKGNVPHNTKTDLHVSVRNMKGRNYKWIRISKDNWQLYNRYVWQQHHGSIPDNMLVAFKDGNTLNCNIENLYLETVEQHMQRNTIHRYSPELKEVFRLVGKLKSKIAKYEKQD